jgi:hypothetical protein
LSFQKGQVVDIDDDPVFNDHDLPRPTKKAKTVKAATKKQSTLPQALTTKQVSKTTKHGSASKQKATSGSKGIRQGSRKAPISKAMAAKAKEDQVAVSGSTRKKSDAADEQDQILTMKRSSSRRETER